MQQLAGQIESLFDEQADEYLRSIMVYESNQFEVVYLRDEVKVQYDTDEIEAVVDDSRMESIVAPTYDETFSSNHGELVCTVKCFENVIELNFVLDEGAGVAVALENGALADLYGIVDEIREVVVEEYESSPRCSPV